MTKSKSTLQQLPIKDKKSLDCGVIKRWVYLCMLPVRSKEPISLCDQCMIREFNNPENGKKIEVVG